MDAVPCDHPAITQVMDRSYLLSGRPTESDMHNAAEAFPADYASIRKPTFMLTW